MPPDSIADAEALAAAAAARPGQPGWSSLEGRVPAAVSVPLHLGARGLEGWLIKRPDTMRHHPREIAFPAGSRDGDEDLRDTALPELAAELGIARERVRVLG